ncbi:MAG: helix-turn-helix domain-containing protein [Alphaproteobacteria bacterium]|nr:helix-turn-helix domain-containing protein [Alphaproteobacteria bacterium]MBQ3946340.1 helix-turn-helix domain-containing protein [Alphaproteobacteria bacterium]
MNTVLKRDLTQFDLTKQTLNNLSQYDITPTAKLVLLYLTDCYNPKHADIFPKQKTIANKLGISERSVMRAVQELFKAGLILIECKHTNRYILTQNTTSQPSQVDKLSQTKNQNVTFTPDNLSPTCKEQIKEQKKQQTVKGGNVYIGDDAILYDYAKTKAKYSVDAYIKHLKQTGSAKSIIVEYKKKTSYPYTLKSTDLLREKREIEKQERTSYETCEAWIKFGVKHGIKK